MKEELAKAQAENALMREQLEDQALSQALHAARPIDLTDSDSRQLANASEGEAGCTSEAEDQALQNQPAVSTFSSHHKASSHRYDTASKMQEAAQKDPACHRSSPVHARAMSPQEEAQETPNKLQVGLMPTTSRSLSNRQSSAINESNRAAVDSIDEVSTDSTAQEGPCKVQTSDPSISHGKPHQSSQLRRETTCQQPVLETPGVLLLVLVFWKILGLESA